MPSRYVRAMLTRRSTDRAKVNADRFLRRLAKHRVAFSGIIRERCPGIYQLEGIVGSKMVDVGFNASVNGVVRR